MSAQVKRNILGRTGIEVSELCVGGGPLGGMKENFGYDTPLERAVETVLATFASPITFIDTSAGYTRGESERRIGEAIRRHEGLPEGFVLETKVDPDFETGRFDGTAVRRSFEGSLERLGVDRVDVLHLHDPEVITFEEATAPDGAVAELVKILDEGLVGHLGVAGGPASLMARYLDLGMFDVLLTHNRWTLADRSADALLTKAHEMGIGVINAAPFGGGVLARGTAHTQKYCYQPMTDATLNAVKAVEQICEVAGIPLGAAALQFSTRDPRIHSTIVGVSRPERIAESLEWASLPIPPDVWQAILDASGTDAALVN